MDKITLFVSVKNREATIEKCVQSLIDVDYPEKKILIADNMSEDKTFEILKNFGDKIDLHRVEGNLSRVFNWALKYIDTKYVAITDSDCVVDKNWVKELLCPFGKNNSVIATAGYCGTPKDVSLLQKIIGMELEQRFKDFPEYISRAPTMNLCLKTEIAKKVLFDESFIYQAFEADFGYRLIKYGKIAYTKKAIISHYHRSDLKGFFLQQKNQAKWAVKLLYKHKARALSDHITTFDMFLQLFSFFLLVFSALLLIINYNIFYPIIFCFVLIISLYLKNIIKINPPVKYYPVFIGLFFFRTFAWFVGIIEGLFFI